MSPKPSNEKGMSHSVAAEYSSLGTLITTGISHGELSVHVGTSTKFPSFFSLFPKGPAATSTIILAPFFVINGVMNDGNLVEVTKFTATLP